MTSMEQWYVFGSVFIGMLITVVFIEYFECCDRRKNK